MIRHYCDEWIHEWCRQNGWTDLFVERSSNYWAFPPGAYIPEPIPVKVLRSIKAAKGLSRDEQLLTNAAIATTGIAVLWSYFSQCPLPLVFAFAAVAIVVGLLELED